LLPIYGKIKQGYLSSKFRIRRVACDLRGISICYVGQSIYGKNPISAGLNGGLVDCRGGIDETISCFGNSRYFSLVGSKVPFFKSTAKSSARF
jgi:hypothetical protein